MKVSANDFGQQAVNELIASRLHEATGWKNYVHYEVEFAKVEGVEMPCSLNPLFTSTDLEFVSAYQLIRFLKKSNEISYYEAIIQEAAHYGLDESEVRKQLEYTIVTDFILTNTDRHFNNFGFLYDSKTKKFVSLAPIFDTGNSLFYDKERIASGDGLLDISVASFKEREADLLQYIKNTELIDLQMLKDFPAETVKYLKKYTCMPEERAEKIAETVRQKMEYLSLFQKGKKIWKKQKYW